MVRYLKKTLIRVKLEGFSIMRYSEKELAEACANDAAWESLYMITHAESLEVIHTEVDTESAAENDDFDWLYGENDDLITQGEE